MKKEKNNDYQGYAYLAIVAVVAIVAVFALVGGNGAKTVDLALGEGENMIGNAANGMTPSQVIDAWNGGVESCSDITMSTDECIYCSKKTDGPCPYNCKCAREQGDPNTGVLGTSYCAGSQSGCSSGVVNNPGTGLDDPMRFDQNAYEDYNVDANIVNIDGVNFVPLEDGPYYQKNVGCDDKLIKKCEEAGGEMSNTCLCILLYTDGPQQEFDGGFR